MIIRKKKVKVKWLWGRKVRWGGKQSREEMEVRERGGCSYPVASSRLLILGHQAPSIDSGLVTNMDYVWTSYRATPAPGSVVIVMIVFNLGRLAL